MGTNTLQGIDPNAGTTICVKRDPIPRSFPSRPMSAAPPNFAYAGVVKMASSSRYSQYPANLSG